MMDVLEAVDAVVERPLRVVVAALVLAVVYLAYFAASADKVHAQMAVKQEVTEKYQTQQDEMKDLLIRIDENVKALKGEDK